MSRWYKGVSYYWCRTSRFVLPRRLPVVFDWDTQRGSKTETSTRILSSPSVCIYIRDVSYPWSNVKIALSKRNQWSSRPQLTLVFLICNRLGDKTKATRDVEKSISRMTMFPSVLSKHFEKGSVWYMRKPREVPKRTWIQQDVLCQKHESMKNIPTARQL